VKTELAGDGADWPALPMIEPHDLRLGLLGDHRSPPSSRRPARNTRRAAVHLRRSGRRRRRAQSGSTAPQSEQRPTSRIETSSSDVAPDRNDRRIEAGFDTARRSRAGTPPTARHSMPPISGHGARAVMNVTASRHRRLQKARGCRPGPSLFGGARRLRRPEPLSPDLHR
jgi:hypothetical protein